MFTEGELRMYIGPMFSGKSTTLIRSLGTYADLGVRVLYVNSALDTRSSEIVSNHSANYSRISKKVDVVASKHLGSVDTKDYDVIGVDEAQFFEDLLCVVDWVEAEDKIVEVAGLDGSFERKQMGSVLGLIPFADHVTKFRAVCKQCLKNGKYREAPFTHRTTTENKELMIGGIESYQPLCRKCYVGYRN